MVFVPVAAMAIYCATKAAMHSLTLSLRYQLKETGIKVFEIVPPSVDTELGHERREDKSQSHGGIPVSEFIEGAMAAIKNDEFEAAIGQSAGLRAKRESLFEPLNSRFQAFIFVIIFDKHERIFKREALYKYMLVLPFFMKIRYKI